jgi:hypothetical protein
LHWKYTGDPFSGEIAPTSSDLYTPLLSGEEIDAVIAYVAERIDMPPEGRGAAESAAPRQPSQASAMPGQEMNDLIVDEFRRAAAMFVAGAGQAMLVAPPDIPPLISFRNIMNKLWDVERGDARQRMLIWMLELGREAFETESISRFMNVEAVLSRFKALRRLKESATEGRWTWLQSSAVIVLHDTSGSAGGGRSGRLPRFDPHHVLFSAVPPRWFGSSEFQKLYGDGRISEANYTIFLSKVSDRTGERRAAPDQRYELRYFGNASFRSNDDGSSHLRSLKLTPPGESYTEALGTVFMAAAQLLGLQGIPTDVSIDDFRISQAQAKEKLQHHGFRLLRLDEFMKF